MSQPPTDSIFARGLYTITKVVGDSPKDGELEVYVVREEHAGKPTSKLEEMLRAGQQPGKLVARFKEGQGVTILEQTIYSAWQVNIRKRLDEMRTNKRGPERILAMYFLFDLLGITSDESHSHQPQPASHHGSL